MYTPTSFASSAGSQTFHYYFARFAKDDAFDIRLISCGKYAEHERVEKELGAVKHHIIYWNAPGKPIQHKIINAESTLNPWNANANLLSNSDQNEILSTIRAYVADGFDPELIILEWTPIVMLAEKIHRICPKAKLVASEHDVAYIGFERKSRYYKGVKGLLWKHKHNWEKKKELDALRMCDLILPHNPDNVDALVQEGIEQKKLFWLIPYFNNMTGCTRVSNRRDILFFGAMGRAENSLSAKWFVEHVMPLLSDVDVRFVILGGNPPQELKDLESERIHVTGFVDSVVPYFESAMCMVAPLVLGAGIKVKVIEALSSGIPLLTNDIGIEGIHAENGKEYFHCQTPEDYARVIKDILNREIDEKAVSDYARAFIATSFSPEKCQSEYRQRLMEIVDL